MQIYIIFMIQKKNYLSKLPIDFIYSGIDTPHRNSIDSANIGFAIAHSKRFIFNLSPK